MCLAQCRKLAGYRVQVQLDMLIYRNWDEQNYVMMLDNVLRNHNDGRINRPGTIPYCQLDVSCDRLLFLS